MKGKAACRFTEPVREPTSELSVPPDLAHIQCRSEPSFSFSDRRWSMPAHCAPPSDSIPWMEWNIMLLPFFLFPLPSHESQLSSRPTPGRGLSFMATPPFLLPLPQLHLVITVKGSQTNRSRGGAVYQQRMRCAVAVLCSACLSCTRRGSPCFVFSLICHVVQPKQRSNGIG